MVARFDSDSAAALEGQQTYERDLRAKLERSDWGRVVAVHGASGDYELADDAISAARALRARHPDAIVFIARIGYPAAIRLGAGLRQRAR